MHTSPRISAAVVLIGLGVVASGCAQTPPPTPAATVLADGVATPASPRTPTSPTAAASPAATASAPLAAAASTPASSPAATPPTPASPLAAPSPSTASSPAAAASPTAVGPAVAAGAAPALSPTAASPPAAASPASASSPTAAAASAPAASPAASPAAGPRALDDSWSGPPGPIARSGARPAASLTAPPEATLARAEAAFQAGQAREALAALDAGPLPADAGDLIALRRAELAFNLDDRARARAELARPELAGSANRVLIVRAAELADRVGDHTAAAVLWLRSTRYFNWTPERAHALERVAFDYAHLGQPDLAADTLASIAEIPAKLPAMKQELAPLAKLGPHHAGLVAAIVGDTATARESFRRYLAEQPKGLHAPMVRTRLAALDRPRVDLDWIAARDTNTVASYRSFAAAYPSEPRVPDARFFEGLVQYRAGQYRAALDTWSGWTAPNVEADHRARAIYWSGRAHEALGATDLARRHWQQAAEVRPSSFYTVRAGDRLRGVLGWPDASGALRAAAPTAAEEAEVAAWFEGWAGPAREPSAGDAAALRRASLFASLGLERTAGAEIDRLIRSSEDPRVIYRAGRLAQDHGVWIGSLRAGLRIAALSPEKASVYAPVGVRLLSYPFAYRDEVQGAAARVDLGPILLLSVMRQESLFDRFAHSPAEARGLTQVIPKTGASVARDLGLPGFQPEQLYDPAQSIAFGSYHLADRIKLFKGDVFRAVASYNAGPEAVATWAPGSDDPDVFVEAIDFRETRGYVKSVYEYQSIYRGVLAGR